MKQNCNVMFAALCADYWHVKRWRRSQTLSISTNYLLPDGVHLNAVGGEGGGDDFFLVCVHIFNG